MSLSAASREVVEEEQASRERTSLKTALGLSLLAAVALQLTRNKNAEHWVLTGTVLALAASCIWVMAESRGREIKPGRMLITGVMTVLVVLAAAAHLGVLTPMIAFLIVTVYYNSSGDAPYERVIYGFAAAGYALLILLSYFGVLPLTDSVLAMSEQNNRALLGFGVMGEGLLYATYRMARQNRLATLTAMDRLERAQRQVQQRDALLLEARAEIDGARAASTGRHTGSQVDVFRVEEVIGRGATGEVYRAIHVGSDEPAALKILFPHLLDDVHVARYVREAELTRELDSPYILRVLGSGHTQDGCPFVATELLVGEDLSQHLRDHRIMSLKAVVEMVSQVATGLNVAQENGIVHRDLKPPNLFLTRSAQGGRHWKVLDFGVAALARGEGELTRGAAVGTPNYMSPEQTRGESVDHRSDVFALGAIAYRALTGQPAFAAADSMSTMYRVNHVQPMKPSLLVKLPKDVDLVLALALAKEKDVRFRSASTFAAALRDASRGELDEPYRAAARELLERHAWMREV
ncbi:MAG: serine/threonine-protein kinase [Polyangiaceae bacterium]